MQWSVDVRVFSVVLNVLRGFTEKCYFLNEISLEKLLRMIGFTYAFENGKKCNTPWMSEFFSLCMLDNVSMESKLLL